MLPIRTDRPAVRTALGLGAMLLGLPLHAGAQQLREVISHEIAVARDEASLHLELSDAPGREGELEISFRDGVVEIDGDQVGSFAWGDPLATAWRELLGRAITLDDGPLAQALQGWTPPPGLASGARATAARVDQALESALADTGPTGARADAAPAPPAPGRIEGLESLLSHTDRLIELAGALEGIDLDEIEVRIGEDVEVAAGEVIGSDLIVVDGDLDVRGTVEGDVVVVGGTLRTFEGSLIEGDVRLADGRLVRDGGTIEGDWSQLDEGGLEREVRDRVREELREEIRSDLRNELRGRDARDGWSFLDPFRTVGRGLVNLLGDLMKTFVVALVGGAVVFFARRNLEVVAETARRAPARAAVVGMSGVFLVLPVYVLGTIALAISIIGLPVLLAWLPLFPVAVGAALALGYYAVAANVGQWMAARRFPGTDWVRSSNLYTLVVAGVVALAVPMLAADVVGMGGAWMAFLRVLLIVVAVLASVAATVIGFGAVLLTRAGRRPEYWGGGMDFFDDWDFDPPGEPTTDAESITHDVKDDTNDDAPGPDARPGSETA